MWLSTEFCVFVIFTCHTFVTCQGSLSDVTYDLFNGAKNGVVAAFGDFNADKLTDIFVLSDGGKSTSSAFLYSERSFLCQSMSNVL